MRKIFGIMVCSAMLSGCSDTLATGTGTGSSGSTAVEGTTGAPPMTDPTGTPTSTDPTSVTDPMTDPSTKGTDGTTSDTDSGDTTQGETTAVGSECGDGRIDVGETCDDGLNNGPGLPCTAMCLVNECGDGDLGPTEECDDGANNGDNNACKLDCTDKFCGDGKVGPGEACDDGNQIDDDTCGNDCSLATCGDGFIQQGVEQCDDKNDINTDACVACANAVCGDNFVRAGVEECDDGNVANNDPCNALCNFSTCVDVIKDGAETDIDCGGVGCPKCAATKACLIGSDCVTGNCSPAKVCDPPQTCKQVLLGNPAAASGLYNIDPDGPGGALAFDAYCDMTSSGGGWTVFYATDGADGQQPMISNTEVLVNDPLSFQNYNTSRAKKIALSLGSTETLFVRPNNIWLRADKPAFDDTLLIVKSTSKKAVNLTVNNGVTVAGFMGFANFNFSGGGDFGISESPDGMTCPNSVTVTGFDHHYVNSRMRNCNCSRQYLYSYSDVGFADNDAGYDAGIPLGSWTATALCDSAEGGLLKFYAAMR